MFAVIDTKGANKIVINVPHEGSEKSLPALARLLEQNATFIKTGWQEMVAVKPEMSITLGDEFTCDSTEAVIKIAASDAVLTEDFGKATHEAFTSNAAALKKERDEVSRLRKELDFVKDRLTRAEEQAKALTQPEEVI